MVAAGCGLWGWATLLSTGPEKILSLKDVAAGAVEFCYTEDGKMSVSVPVKKDIVNHEDLRMLTSSLC